MPESTCSYLICATPRSGSTLLCGLLRSTGIAGRPESYFRFADEQSWADRWQITHGVRGDVDYQDYVRAAVAAGSTDNGVFGARVMWGTLDEMVAKLGAVHPDLAGADVDLLTSAFGRTRFIHLWREDVVAQAVSWTRAEQTKFWHPRDRQEQCQLRKGGPGDAGHHRDTRKTASQRCEPYFDFDQIDGFVQTINEHNAAWRAWFAAHGVRPHQVRYEELTVDMAGTTRSLLDFLDLDLPGDRAIVPRDRRQADEVNADWIARYRAIAGGAGLAAENTRSRYPMP